MGHYDDCREAHEEVQKEKEGARMRAWVNKLTDKELGDLRSDLDALMEMRNSFVGTHNNTQRFVQLTDRIRKVLGI